MNVQFVLIHAAIFMFLFPAGITEKLTADTLKIKTEGAGNHIRINSALFSSIAVDTVITAGATGEIDQVGENNQVEIKTGREIPNNKSQITNNNQKPNSKNQTNNKQRGASNEEPATIKIQQTGKNNTVKINQR